MHAFIVDVEINDRGEAEKGLDETVLPAIKAAPGFVAGYWIRLGDGQGTSVVVFESKDQAIAGAPKEGDSGPGVTITRVIDGEVLRSA